MPWIAVTGLRQYRGGNGRRSHRTSPPAAQKAYRAAPKMAYEHAPSVREHVPLAARADGGFEFRTNELGLRRDFATAIPKPHGLRRVLVLGDSQTDGYVANGGAGSCEPSIERARFGRSCSGPVMHGCSIGRALARVSRGSR